MKRGIPIALQAAGAVLACLVTTVNHPVIANVQTVKKDTVRYYDRYGVEIFCQTNAQATGNYIIRTFKKRHRLFNDWYGRSINSGDYKPADVCRIKRKEARKTRMLIQQGQLENPLVLKCIVPILDKASIKKMLDSIIALRRKDRSTFMYREYGGEINGDTTFKCKRGDSTNPCEPENKGLVIGVGANGNFHSHPEGNIEIKDSSLIPADIYSTGNSTRIFYSGHRESKTCNFVQGPSYRDQQSIKDKTGYVFGMFYRKVYLFDKHGVCATLPFSSLLTGTVNK